MRITIFIGGLIGGGAERVACNLANSLTAFGHTVEMLTMSDAKGSYPLDGCITRVDLLKECERKNDIYNTLLRMRRLRRYLKEHTEVDAYVVMLPVTITMMILARGATKAKIILSERNDPVNYSSLIQKLMRYSCKKADGMVFQTDAVKAWYAKDLKKTESAVISNAINPAFIRPAYEGEREKVIVGVGRFDTQKNFPLLIRAFARIAGKFPDYKLAMYGQGRLLESYQSLAAELGIGGRVEFPGFCTNMPERLERAGMFVLSSDFEGMPNALMEAMASGLPCVSTDCGGGGARFLIRDGENGLLVPIGDEVALADAMEKVLSDEELAAKLGNTARKLQETLAPDKIYGEWESFITKLWRETI